MRWEPGRLYYVDPALVPRSIRRSRRLRGLVGTWVRLVRVERLPFDPMQLYAHVEGRIPCVVPADWLAR